MAGASRRVVPPKIEILAVVDNMPRFNLTCTECGSCEQTTRGITGIMAMLHCAGCGGWHGRLSAITAHAIAQAQEEGYEIDKRAAVNEVLARTKAPQR